LLTQSGDPEWETGDPLGKMEMRKAGGGDMGLQYNFEGEQGKRIQEKGVDPLGK